MNTEDYNKIKNNQTLLYILTCAYRGRYLVAVSNYNAKILKDIYERTFPNKPKPSTNCGKCVYDFCYELGKDLEEYNKPEEPEPKETAEEEVEEEKPNEEEQPKKKGSKKKAKK